MSRQRIGLWLVALLCTGGCLVLLGFIPDLRMFPGGWMTTIGIWFVGFLLGRWALRHLG